MIMVALGAKRVGFQTNDAGDGENKVVDFSLLDPYLGDKPNSFLDDHKKEKAINEA